MRKRLLVALLAGALAGCGGSGTSSSTSTGSGGAGGSPGTGGVGAAPADLAVAGGSDGGVATPGVDAGLPPTDLSSGPIIDGGDGGNDGGGGDAGPPCPTTPATLGTSGQPGPVATNSHYVYWLDYALPRTIWRVPRAGGAAEQVATDTYGNISPVYLAADDDGVYWGSTTYPGGQSAGVSNIFALRPNGSVDTLASGALVEDLVLSGSTIFFVDRYGTYAVSTATGGKQTVYDNFSQFDEASLTVDPWHLFVQQNGVITRVDRTTGVSDVLGSFDGVALAVDFNRAYSLADGVVYAVPPTNGLQLSPANGSGVGGHFLTIDGTNLYYGGPNGDLSRLASDGSGYSELAPAATAAIVDGNRIIYSHDSEVSAVCK